MNDAEVFKDIIPLSELDNYENPYIIAHFTHPSGAEWHVVAGDKQSNGDWLLFGIGKITVQELGYFTLKEILGVGAEIDTDWEVVKLYDLI